MSFGQDRSPPTNKDDGLSEKGLGVGNPDGRNSMCKFTGGMKALQCVECVEHVVHERQV